MSPGTTPIDSEAVLGRRGQFRATLVVLLIAATTLSAQETPRNRPAGAAPDKSLNARAAEGPEPAKAAETGAGQRPDPLAVHRASERDALIARLATRTARIQQEIRPFTTEKNLIDNLYYPLFDRPRRRASLAVLVKTSQILDEELSAHRRGRGVVPIGRLTAITDWCIDTLDRLGHTEPDRGRLPQRIHMSTDRFGPDADARAVRSPPAGLAGWADGSRRPYHPETRDLDLMACLGARVYTVAPDLLVSVRERRTLLAHCQSLGIGFVDRLDTDGLPPSRISQTDPPAVLGFEESQVARIGIDLTPLHPAPGGPSGGLRAIAGWPDSIWRIYAPAISELLGPRQGTTRFREFSVVPAVRDSAAEPTWAESLIAREILWGTGQHDGLTALRWRVPRVGPVGASPTAAQWRVGMWLHVLAGQRLGFLDGWTEAQSAEPTPWESILLHPDLMESAAHTALEIQAAGTAVFAFPGERDLAFVIGPDLWLADQARWSDDLLDLYVQCAAHQLYPRMLPLAGLPDLQRDPSARVIVILHGGEGWNERRNTFQALRRAGTRIIAWERRHDPTGGAQSAAAALADSTFIETVRPGALVGHLIDLWDQGAILRKQARFTVNREADQGLVYARSGLGPGGRYVIGLVNGSPGIATVRVKLPSPYSSRTYLDFVTGRKFAAGTLHNLKPWAVTLLASEGAESPIAATK